VRRVDVECPGRLDGEPEPDHLFGFRVSCQAWSRAADPGPPRCGLASRSQCCRSDYRSPDKQRQVGVEACFRRVARVPNGVHLSKKRVFVSGCFNVRSQNQLVVFELPCWALTEEGGAVQVSGPLDEYKGVGKYSQSKTGTVRAAIK
jgi:hypothetical protein